ncbi:MAG: ATPase [Gammaproteobacteria bacterium RIFCSPHIGHO2_12_FULL_45_9]|nr:MAG: ATPase [Gammaproteobacteria bacterium RIFCSPHIGHO2_12_FULL_45_9]
MDPQFLVHNTHWDDPLHFADQDPQLKRLKKQPLVWSPALLSHLPRDIPGIYTLGGGRQIGKTTLLKQWMVALMASGISPHTILFLSGELIDDHHALLHTLQHALRDMPTAALKFILLDEVTYIREWDKGIKYAADAALLDDVILLITGSDLVFIQEARMRFPGRRGTAAVADFHLNPLSFRECVQLTQPTFATVLDALSSDVLPSHEELTVLFQAFDRYCLHGGYLTAINDVAKYGHILSATLATYSDWIRGDMLKRGKNETYLREVLSALLKRYLCQITWNTLAQDLSIDHPATVADYVHVLERMDVLFVQAALLEDKLVAAPKKARRVLLNDPFIYHAIRAWLMPSTVLNGQITHDVLQEPESYGKIVEAAVIAEIKRHYPTFYIKAEGEVDVAYVHHDQFWPIEIKWTNQLRTKDLKQVLKYPHAEIWSKQMYPGQCQHLSVRPLPWALYRFGMTGLDA